MNKKKEEEISEEQQIIVINNISPESDLKDNYRTIVACGDIEEEY